MSNLVPANGEKALVLTDTNFDHRSLQSWSEGLNTDRTDMLKKAMIGLILIFGFGGVWSCTAPLGGAVIAGGRVIAEDRNRPIQHLDGGVIKDVGVREGDTVKEGDVLMVLDTVSIDAALESNRLKKTIAQLELARYRAEVTESTTVDFPTDIEPAVAQHPRVLEALQSQQEAFETGLKDRMATAKNIDTKILGLRGDIEGHNKVLVALERQLELFELELADFKVLMEQGHIQRTRVFATERKVVELVATIQGRKLSIEKSANDILIYESEKEQQRYRFLAQSNERLVATQKALNDAEAAVLQLTDRMERAVVRSPVTGTVFQLAKRTVGEVIKPGETVVILFPEDDALTIEARLQATDRDEVFVGQDVQVIFPSDQENQGLPINGTLIYVSADTITTDSNLAGNYIVKVKLPADAAPGQMVPGNIAEVYIQTEPKTFMEIISEPFTRFAFKAFKG